MVFDIRQLDSSMLAAMAAQYEADGYFQISGIESSVTTAFHPLLSLGLGSESPALDDILDHRNAIAGLDKETRRRLSRVQTTPELSATLLAALGPMIRHLAGPFAQVSNSFHGQFKWGNFTYIDHPGYAAGSDYMEVQGPYLLHQDFAGASLPTSPSAITLWVPLNTSPDWNLRLYPGSHRQGLLCHQFLSLEDQRLKSLREPVDVAAQRGTAVVFNAMLLHGTSNPGPRRRVSCDIRFFPLCGFLPSEVHFLHDQPIEYLRQRMLEVTGPTLRAPLEEIGVFLGTRPQAEAAEPYSALNWPHHLYHSLHGETETAAADLQAMVNTEIGVDPFEVYASKFGKHPITQAMIQQVHEKVAARLDLQEFVGRSLGLQTA